MSRKPNRYSPLQIALMIGIVVMILASAILLAMCLSMPIGSKDKPDKNATIQFSQPEEVDHTVPEGPPQLVSTASIGVQGDLLMHLPVIETCVTGSGYDFSYIFQYMKPYTKAYDYMVANLETTLGGTSFPYRGNPSFNCPDQLLTAVKDMGCDMLLTANNHSYDTLMTGIDRTLQQVRGAGLETLGTRLNGNEKRYSVIDVNGIQVGMVCYTFSLTMDEKTGNPRLNNNSPVEKPEQINYFSNDNLGKLYSEMADILPQMKADGAETTVLYIHWGTEYDLIGDENQRAIAQKMCDMGVDVIVGGHPHVVQPMTLLTSNTDSEHKTVCIYSLGNAVSNQRREEMDMKTGHTEDGLLFSMTFEKYSDGTVRVSSVDVLPTWVNMTSSSGQKQYLIIPLEDAKRDNWQSEYHMTDEEYAEAKNSYDRTMAIVGAGLQMVQGYLAEQ